MVFINITVCIGSGCHVKGSRDIINILKEYIKKKDRTLNLDLEACFCQEHCTEGVVVKFDQDLVTNVSKDNILDILINRLEGED